jgi:hypothetical protein
VEDIMEDNILQDYVNNVDAPALRGAVADNLISGEYLVSGSWVVHAAFYGERLLVQYAIHSQTV